jgi:signal transduction histidine kinase
MLEVPLPTAELEQQALATLSSEGVVILDGHGVVVRVNQRAKSMLGWFDDDVGQLVSCLLERAPIAGTDGVPLPVDRWPGLRALGGETIRNHDIGIHRDGRTTWLSTSAIPITLVDGTLSGAVVSLSDVTMLHNIEQHHEQMLRLVSHDIRNPLTSVHLNAQLLEKALAERGLEKEQRLATVVIGAARRLDAMIQELVDSSRVRSGQLRLDLRPIAVERVVPEILAHNASIIDTARVRIALPSTPVLLTGDVVRLERVVTSLLVIALQNCPDNAEVTLHVAQVDDEIRFSTTIPGQSGACDQSPPPPSSPFNQTKPDRGYGMGLFIARMLVERHGGRLWVEGLPEYGTTIHFALPLGGPDGELPRPQ